MLNLQLTLLGMMQADALDPNDQEWVIWVIDNRLYGLEE